MIRAKYNKPDSGWDYDKEMCRRYLTLNEIYSVYKIEVHSWHTDVYLSGFERPFNSVNFTYYDEEGNEIDLHETDDWKHSNDSW